MQGNKYPRYEIFVRRQAWKITMRTHRAAVLLPKRRLVRLASEYLHETVQSPVLLEPRDMAYIEKCRCKGFSRGIMLGAFNKLTIFLARPVTLPPFRAKTSPRLFCRSTGTRRKALLMRSLIRSIGECFADRSDVYPSRSATTRCASSPQHTAKRI